MTAGTTLTFINQTTMPAASSISGAAGGTVVVAGPGTGGDTPAVYGNAALKSPRAQVAPCWP